MMTIILRTAPGEWRYKACITDDYGKWSYGHTIEEAMGKLVLNLAFNIMNGHIKIVDESEVK